MAETKEAGMVERLITVAIAADDQEGWTITHKDAESIVRAILAELRKPTQAMRHACWDLLEKNAAVGNLKPGGIRGSGFPDVLLDRMISAALAQDPPHVV